jgi:hypothetical protein
MAEGGTVPKEEATLYVRHMDPAVVRQLRANATLRGISMAEYLARLVEEDEITKLLRQRAENIIEEKTS